MQNAQSIYDQIEAKLKLPEFRPRALFKRFNIEVMCTTDAATDPLTHHQALRKSGWDGNIRPTFRPDAVVNLLTPGWSDNIKALSKASGINVTSYKEFIRAIENRRAFFKSMGAVATDHASETAYTAELGSSETEGRLPARLAGQDELRGRAPVYCPHDHGVRSDEH